MTEEQIIEEYNKLVVTDKQAIAEGMREIVKDIKSKTNTLYAQGFPEAYAQIVQNLTHLANTIDPPKVETPTPTPASGNAETVDLS